MNLKHVIKLVINWIFRHKQIPFIYVAVGDSTVEGIGASHSTRAYPSIIYATIQQSYKNSFLYNLGKANARIHDVLVSQLDNAIELKPDLITISIGANDVRKATSLSKFEKDLRFILKRLKEETSAEIVMNNIPDFSIAPAVPGNLRSITKLQIVRFNKKIESLTLEFGVILVDLFKQTKIYAEHYPESIYKDGFHPSDFGYAIWANSIIMHIKDTVFRVEKRKTLTAND